MGQGSVLFSTTRGDGATPVLILHGFLGSGRNLATLCRRWSERAPQLRLISADLPGHGRSEPLSEGATLTTMARLALETLPKEGPFRLVGHSLGGRVALRAFALAPQRCERLTVLDITPGPIGARSAPMEQAKQAMLAAPERAESRAAMQEALAKAGLSGPLAAWLLMNVEASDGAFSWSIDREALIEFGQRSSQEDLWPCAEAAGSKLTCIRAERSPYVSDEETARYAQLGAQVHTVKDAGHFVHIDKPDQVLDLLSV